MIFLVWNILECLECQVPQMMIKRSSNKVYDKLCLRFLIKQMSNGCTNFVAMFSYKKIPIVYYSLKFVKL